MGLPRGRFKEVVVGEDRGALPPSDAGIYHLLGADRRLLKVGLAADLSTRYRQWRRAERAGAIDRFTYGKVHGNTSLETLREIERAHIRKHDPPWNERAGGGGRPPRRRR